MVNKINIESKKNTHYTIPRVSLLKSSSFTFLQPKSISHISSTSPIITTKIDNFKRRFHYVDSTPMGSVHPDSTNIEASNDCILTLTSHGSYFKEAFSSATISEKYVRLKDLNATEHVPPNPQPIVNRKIENKLRAPNELLAPLNPEQTVRPKLVLVSKSILEDQEYPNLSRKKLEIPIYKLGGGTSTNSFETKPFNLKPKWKHNDSLDNLHRKAFEQGNSLLNLSMNKQSVMNPKRCSHCHEAIENFKQLCDYCGEFKYNLEKKYGPELTKLIMVIGKKYNEMEKKNNNSYIIPNSSELKRIVSRYVNEILGHSDSW